MPGFSIRNPYFIIVICLALLVIGVTSLARMPVDLFPPINLPEVVVATFYSGMPPEDIETDITDPLERFFTLASGMDHMESRSLLGVSIIRVYFQPGTSPDADVTELVQPGSGRPEAPATGNAPSSRSQVRRLQLAGGAGHRQRRRTQRNSAPRLRSVPDSQPDRGRARRRNPRPYSAGTTARSWSTSIPTSWLPAN